MHERNNEIGNWIWIDVGLVIVGMLGGLPRASLQIPVVSERGAEEDERVRLRGEADINQSWLSV